MDCEKCKSGSMIATKVSRLSGCLVAIGYTLLVPSLLILGSTALGIISGTSETKVPPTEQGAATIGSGSVAFVIYFIFVPVLIVGFLLVLRKKVWKCNSCGYIFDRA